MRKCIRCGAEMTKGFTLKSSFALLQEIELVDDECTFNRFGSLRVAVCPVCGEVSLYTDNEELLDIPQNSFVNCPKCEFPVYEDQRFCPHCGHKNKNYNKHARTVNEE